MSQIDNIILDPRPNKSRTYLLPVFAKYIPISYVRLLRNTYLWYDNITDETFCLLYKFDGKLKGSRASRQGFTVYEEKTICKHPLYVGSRDFNELVFYEFILPEEMYELRRLFLEGKYSQFSPDMKAVIHEWTLRYYGTNEANYIKQVFRKDKELRDEIEEKIGSHLLESAELSSVPDIERELFSENITYKQQKEEENESEYLL